jgi:O-antigen/teichoic acid export membrane protein
VTATLLQRVQSHTRVPLFRQGYALILSSAIAAGLGFVFWLVAARMYSPETVGLNSAAISAMLFISGLSQLNLSSALMRFLPSAGRKTGRLIVLSYALPTVVGAVSGAIFLIGLDTWTPNLAFLTHNAGFEIWFIAAVIGWNVFALQDAILTGFRRAIWVAADATLFSVIRLVLLIALAGPLPAYGMFASWTAAIVASIIPINLFIVHRLVRPRARTTTSDGAGVSARRLVHYVGLDYIGWMGFLAATTLIPLMITQRAGGAENAYFSLAWAIVFPLYLLSSNMGMSLVVSAADDEEKLGLHLRRAAVQTLRLAVPLVLLVVLLAPYLLRLFGPAYASHGTDTLRLVALSAIPNIVTTLYVYACRAGRKMVRLAIVLTAECSMVVILSYLLLDPWGIAGVGAAWVIAQSIVAVAILIRTMPAFLAQPGTAL